MFSDASVIFHLIDRRGAVGHGLWVRRGGARGLPRHGKLGDRGIDARLKRGEAGRSYKRVACVGGRLLRMSDGGQAVETWASGSWDLTLMDIQMPVMDGLRATRVIRRLETEGGRLRTPIALTANVMQHQVAEYAAAGMDAVVGNPMQLAELLSAVEAVLSPAPRERAQVSA